MANGDRKCGPGPRNPSRLAATQDGVMEHGRSLSPVLWGGTLWPGAARMAVLIALVFGAVSCSSGNRMVVPASPLVPSGAQSLQGLDGSGSLSVGSQVGRDGLYRLRPGDELKIVVINQPQFTTGAKVGPDGKLMLPGAGEIQAAGMTLTELNDEVRSRLSRLLRYPEVSVLLTKYSAQLVYVFGEVEMPGAQPFTPGMTVLHALGGAAGATTRARLSNVVVLRRRGPSDLDVYVVDANAALKGKMPAFDLRLEPYDVVYVPRTLIADINVFVDQFIRQNISPFTAYIEGWRAFNMERVSFYRYE